MPKKPWFKDGLRFECTQCGDCCTGAPGYVWVNADEIKALAATVGVSVEEFEAKFVRQLGKRKSLIEYENGDCVFFDGKTRKCKVYGARPRQCKTWPFWDSNIETPADLAAHVPGVPWQRPGACLQRRRGASSVGRLSAS